MGFIQDSSGTVPDFYKAVISLWFRVPQASIDAAKAAYNPQAPDGTPFNGVLPFIVFGPDQTQTIYTDVFHQFGTSAVFIDPGTGGGTIEVDVPVGAYFSSGKDVYCDPSYIGLAVATNGTDKFLYVVANLQTGVRATLTDYNFIAGSAELVGGISGVWYPTSALDVGYTSAGTPEAYQINVKISDPTSFADKWHHLLISCDLTNAISTSNSDTYASGINSVNHLWVALDDVNYVGNDAFPYYPGPPFDVNSTTTAAASSPAGISVSDVQVGLQDKPVWVSAGIFTGYAVARMGGLDVGTLTATGFLPSSKISMTPLGIPATAGHSGNIYKIEMAEFQMFTGVSMDTSIEANRRAFIDADGKPVNPQYAQARAGSSAPGTPPDLLGKMPDVALARSSGAWIGGHNLGTATTDFTKTGTIKPFTPSPQLGK